MRVIKEPDVFKSIRVDCKCTAVLEVEFSDIRRHYSDHRDGYEDYAYIICPCCNKRHVLHKGLIPEYLYDKLKQDEGPYWR